MTRLLDKVTLHFSDGRMLLIDHLHIEEITLQSSGDMMGRGLIRVELRLLAHSGAWFSQGESWVENPLQIEAPLKQIESPDGHV